MSEEEEAPRNIFSVIAHLIPPLAFLGRSLEEGRYGRVAVVAALAIALIVAAVMQWGAGVIGIVAEIATAVVGLVILSLTS